MSKPTNELKQTERLQSLDVLRGFDMLWIAGGGLIVALAQTTKWGWLQVIAEQMEHVVWDGFHFEDLIFPLFMFISGVAIPYAITAKVEQGVSKKSLLHKIVKRGLILVFLGLFVTAHLETNFRMPVLPAYSVKSVLVIYSLQQLSYTRNHSKPELPG